MTVQAVLTGDIVNSTGMGAAAEKRLLKSLQQLLADHSFEFYRGDSFQVYIKDAGNALPVALMCRAAAISIGGRAGVLSDIRISIGLGKVVQPVKTLGTGKGDAFVLSGRAFDTLAGTDNRLAISTANQLANEGLEVIAAYLGAIFKVMTGKQAGVIFELLKGESQQEVAVKLKKSKSTIHQHVTAGRWTEIEKLVQHYKNIINQLL
ncbi:MAG: hypothetical protein ABIU63_07530 [Chitinophagaceae bacterium]